MIVVPILFLFALTSTQVTGNSAFRDECAIDIRSESDNPTIPPLLTSDVNAWVLPSLDEKIHLESGSTVRLACPGHGFEDSDLKDDFFWTAKCVKGLEFEIEGLGKTYSFSDLSCADWPQETVEVLKDTTCGPSNEAKLTIVQFETAKGYFNELFVSCVNFDTYQSLWSSHTLHKEIGQRTYYGEMPYFSDDNLYDFEVWIAYTRSKQTETVAVLVGSEDLAEEYVHPSGDIYMVRGHLSPKADFQFTSWQRATYHYINAQPQWQGFNGGHWVDIENVLRDYVSAQQKDHLVITGSSGVIALDNIDGQKVDIYLNIDNPTPRLATPRFYWKVVIEPVANLGVVIVGVNNVHLKESEVDENFRLCDPIPNHPLLADVHDQNEIARGIVYACTLEAAQSALPEIPKDISVDGVLGV